MLVISELGANLIDHRYYGVFHEKIIFRIIFINILSIFLFCYEEWANSLHSF